MQRTSLQVVLQFLCDGRLHIAICHVNAESEQQVVTGRHHQKSHVALPFQTVFTRSIAAQSAIRTRNCDTSVQVDLLSTTYADPVYNYGMSIPT